MATLEITTMSGCPLQCSYCPQDKFKASYSGDKYLTIEHFRAILSKIPTDVRIDFSGMSEPWANPSCTDMFEYTLQQGYPVAVYTTLYGMEDPERVAALVMAYQSQIEVICLHLPDADGNMRGWKSKPEWHRAFQIIVNSRFPRLTAMTMDKTGAMHPDLVARYAFQLPGWEAISRAGTLETDKPYKIPPRHKTKITCRTTPLYDHNVLLPNGDVVLCCMDYSLKHKLGNLLDQDYQSLFAGEMLQQLIAINTTEGFSKCSICKSCDNVVAIKERALSPVNRDGPDPTT